MTTHTFLGIAIHLLFPYLPIINSRYHRPINLSSLFPSLQPAWSTISVAETGRKALVEPFSRHLVEIEAQKVAGWGTNLTKSLLEGALDELDFSQGMIKTITSSGIFPETT